MKIRKAEGNRGVPREHPDERIMNRSGDKHYERYQKKTSYSRKETRNSISIRILTDRSFARHRSYWPVICLDYTHQPNIKEEKYFQS